MKKNSSPASNRTIRDKTEKKSSKKTKRISVRLPIRYLSDNKTELYKQFYENNTNLIANQNLKMCKTTFNKYLNETQIYKKPHRLTDLCDYCEFGLKLKKELSSILIADQQEQMAENFDINEILNYYKMRNLELEMTQRDDANEMITEQSENIKSCIKKINEFKVIKTHKYVAKTQREAYTSQTNNSELLLNSVLIDIDFKQKILIGKLLINYLSVNQ